jgi:hypothetical protein
MTSQFRFSLRNPSASSRLVGLQRYRSVSVQILTSSRAARDTSSTIGPGGYSSSSDFRPEGSTAVAARRIESYPVHRHRFPTKPRRACSASSFRPPCIRSHSDTTKPGVQKPHCVPWQLTIACWIGFN